MPPIFSETDKKTIRNNLLVHGLTLVKVKGFRKMSIDELVQQCNIAKGTFYHFFESKQMFIIEMIQKCREKNLVRFNKELEKEGTIEVTQLLDWYKTLQTDPDNPLLYMTTSDAQWMRENVPSNIIFNLEMDIEIAKQLLGKVRNVREDIDYAFAANIPKMILLIMEHRDEMHEEALAKNIDMILLNLKQYLEGTIDL